MLSPEKATEIKQQLIDQIKASFPKDKQYLAISKINTMSNEELESFLIQNKIAAEKPSENKCIFCSIISGEIPSNTIDENKYSIAVLEINPISSGHMIIIPKKHSSNSETMPSQVFGLAKKVAKRIKLKLKPKEILFSSGAMFGHSIVNVIPIYNEERIDSERKPAKKEELEKLKTELEAKPRKKREKKEKKVEAPKSEERKIWLPKRFP